MKRDEKICPQCAETIKKAAHLCKHCGHRFPEEQVKAAVVQQNNTGLGIGCIVTIVVLSLMLSVCSDGGDDDQNNEGKAAEADASPFADEGKQAMWIVATQDGVRARLKDPDSAKFRDTRFYSGGPAAVVCGQVNAKNAFGGFTGFERFIASGEKLAFLESDMASPSEMDDAWKKMCVKAPRDEAYVP